MVLVLVLVLVFVLVLLLVMPNEQWIMVSFNLEPSEEADRIINEAIEEIRRTPS